MLTPGLIAIVLAAPTGFTAAVERIPLVRVGSGAPELRVEAIAARIVVKRARLKEPGHRGTLCPDAKPSSDSLVLTCSSRRLWAELSDGPEGLALDVRLLRGLPWEGELKLPLRVWPMRAYGVPDDCPGRLDATRGQCALAEGDVAAAERAFKKARVGPDANFAYLRLGELALARNQPEEAAHLFAFVAPAGPIGRLAKARLCDLTGTCLDEKASRAAGDTFALDGPVRGELDFITWRREILLGREANVMAPFVEGLEQDASMCDGVVPLCQLMLLSGLTAPDESVRSAAVSGWLVPTVRQGPYELDLARATSRAAAELGAPSFAAAVLASVSDLVPPKELDAHLRRAVELYLEAADAVRAGAIYDYAETRLGRQAVSRGAWRLVRSKLKGGQRAAQRPAAPVSSMPVAALETNVELAKDLARAAAARSRAQQP